ncbi:hypothetical protein TcG_12857 [Trypanosoma cruzi]|nr:hypothetical protein TcG_12857 [Trypanosoma cruzi]
MQENKTVLCKAHALLPVVLLFTLPAHTPTHISPHRRRIPEQSIHSTGDTHWHVQQRDEKQSALVQALPTPPNRLHISNVSKINRRLPSSLARDFAARIFCVRPQQSRRFTEYA